MSPMLKVANIAAGGVVITVVAIGFWYPRFLATCSRSKQSQRTGLVRVVISVAVVICRPP